MSYRIGIDAGSKTIKVVILNEDNTVYKYIYRKHKSDIQTTLTQVIHELAWRVGDIRGAACITGSAGIGVAEMLGLPFVQEVVATTRAVKTMNPDVDAVIELGGEDAKVMYLTDGMEQRMNATCAGGTGGFIDSIAFMLGLNSKQVGLRAAKSTTSYPIASRCAVFAETDVRPLLNAGVNKDDIAASVLDAVVRQTLGGLACGRPIEGNVIFLGGPFEYLPELARRFNIALGGTGFKPDDAHLYIAQGAAISAGEDNAPVVSLKSLEHCLLNSKGPEDDLEHLPPLFTGDNDRAHFKERHAKNVMEKSSFAQYEGDAYLGLDAGSTTVKLALVGDDGQLIYSNYAAVEGDALNTAKWMLEQMYTDIPKLPGDPTPVINIKHATVTGYGEDLMMAALGIDSGIVETTAHLRGALSFDPETSFILDIGGQDMKALWVKDGVVTDAVLNEACSSGCGSFIEGTAYSLRSTPYRFADLALESQNPIDLGTKCTVFMTSRVRHAQKIGASHADIAAGLAYSVVQNALFRIIGRDKLSSMGSHIVVQGGTFKSDAVLAAFEKVSGLQVIRPDTAHLMGAIGCALTARERAQVAFNKARSRKRVRSKILNRRQLQEFNPKREAVVCPGCQNACTLTKLSFGAGRTFISGNRCDNAYDALDLGAAPSRGVNAPNVMKLQQNLLLQCKGAKGKGARKDTSIGIMNTLFAHDQLPFWEGFFKALGFSVIVPQEQRTREAAPKSAVSIPSESVCFPAKLSHSRLYDLADAGANAVFMPMYERGTQCSVSCEYAQVLKDNAPVISEGKVKLVAPLFFNTRLQGFENNEDKVDALLNALNAALDEMGVEAVSLNEAQEALTAARAAQDSYEGKLKKATEHALEWVHEDPERHGLILAGRPYHIDPMIMHGIDGVIEKLGLAVLTEAGLRLVYDLPEEGEMLSDRSVFSDASRHDDVIRWDIADDSLDAVLLHSFGCGFDSIALEVAKEQLSWYGLPCTILKIDDMIDTAHVRIRLRTLAESIESRKAHALLLAQEAEEARKAYEASGEGEEGPDENPLGLGKGARMHLEGMQLNFGDQSRADELAEDGLMQVDVVGIPVVTSNVNKTADAMQFKMTHADLDIARSYAPSDMCFTAASLAARVISIARKDPRTKKVAVPYVCQGCMLDALPDVVRHAIGRSVEIEWTNGFPKENRQGSQLAPLKPEDPLRIGIMGNPLLVYEPYLNDDLVDMIEGFGCTCVMPTAENLYVDDVRYFDQLAEFAEKQVDHVIYLQSFGCLKGHVHARGSLHELKDLYPNMPVTVIDYDPEASALNRENRVRLAVEAAHAARPSAVMRMRTRSKATKWLKWAQDSTDTGRRELLSDSELRTQTGTAALAFSIESYRCREECKGPEQVDDMLSKRREACLQELAALQEEATILNLALGELDSLKEEPKA